MNAGKRQKVSDAASFPPASYTAASASGTSGNSGSVSSNCAAQSSSTSISSRNSNHPEENEATNIELPSMAVVPAVPVSISREGACATAAATDSGLWAQLLRKFF